MTTITEDYVSFETAKLLKEKGFDEGCSFVVNAVSKGVMPVSWPTTNSEIEDEKADLIALPTLQMAMKWLREEKNILIYVYPVIDLQVKNNYTFYWRWDGKKKRHDASHIGDKHNYESFEQAVEAAVKYCLENLI